MFITLRNSYVGVSLILCIALTISHFQEFELTARIVLCNSFFFSILTSLILHYVKNDKIAQIFQITNYLINLMICSTLWIVEAHELSQILMLECIFISNLESQEESLKVNIDLFIIIYQLFIVCYTFLKSQDHISQLSLCAMIILIKLIFYFMVWRKNKKEESPIPMAIQVPVQDTNIISQFQSLNKNEISSTSYRPSKDKDRNESISSFHDNLSLIRTLKEIYENQQIVIISDDLKLQYCNFDLSKLLKKNSIARYQEYNELLELKCKYLNSNNILSISQVVKEVIINQIRYSHVKLIIAKESTKKVIVQIIYFSELKNILLHIVKFKNKGKVQKHINKALLIDICKSLSHNLGTNLNSIQTFSTYALNDQQISAIIKDTYIKPIHTNCQQLNLIISNLRDYNLINLNQFDLNLEQFSIQQEILFIQGLFHDALEKRKIKVLNCLTDAIIFNDRNRFRQVYFQIFQNAVKFTEQGLIRTEINLYRNIKNNWQYQILVTDSGIGMNNSEHRRLETIITSGEFIRVSKNSVGSGFGICISNLIIKHLSGNQESLICEPLAVGCKFEMKLKVFNPDLYILEKQNDRGVKIFRDAHSYYEQFESLSSHYIEQKASKLSALENTPRQNLSVTESNVEIVLSNLDYLILTLNQNKIQLKKNIEISGNCCSKVLLVDDEVFNITCLQMILRKFTKVTDSAYNGREALNKIQNKLQNPCKTCQNQYYQFIFLDINMPVLDGIETAAQIKILVDQNVIKGVWMIANSGFCDLETKMNAYEAGCDHQLTKPIDEQKLSLIVEQLILRNEEDEKLNKI